MPPMSNWEKLWCLKRKAEKPLAYDLNPEEWAEYCRNDRENPKVFYDIIELGCPFETASDLQDVTGMNEVPAVHQVETRPVFPEKVSPRMMNVCRFEYRVWKPVHERLLREGFENHETRILFQGQQRYAKSYKKTNVSCK